MKHGLHFSLPKPKSKSFLFSQLHDTTPTRTFKTAPSTNPSPYETPLHILLNPLSTQHHHRDHPHSLLLTYAPLFQFLTGRNHLQLGKQIHAHMTLLGLEPNAFLAAKMVAMYASSGDIDSALAVFERIRYPSRLLFNSIIRACSKFGFDLKSLELYCRMWCLGAKGDNFTFPFVLKCCSDLGSVWFGKCVHGQCVKIGFEFDVYVGTSLIDMYVKCCQLGDGRKLFDKMRVRDVSSWNALIAGYMGVGDVGGAEDLFRRLPCRNVVSWTAMVSGYTQHGLAERALSLVDEMLMEDSEVKPNWVTVMSVLPALAHSAALGRGRRIHDYIRRVGLELSPLVQTALISMYAKCGSLVDARRCFDRMPERERNLVTWNTMVTAYASHGNGMEAVKAFEDMIGCGVKPDAITFTGLLSGCSHSGLTNIGLKYFDCMNTVFSVEPSYQHFACVVDLLSRAGRLREAKEFIDGMPMEAGASSWGALLAACCKHRNVEIAEIAAKKLFTLEPENGGNYVILSNLYAEAQLWDKVKDLRNRLKYQSLKKTPGCSWIEVNGKALLFHGGDSTQPFAKELYKLLEALPGNVKASCHAPETSSVFE